MTEFRTVTPDFFVAGQLTPVDIAEAAALGVKLVINNRPEGELSGPAHGLGHEGRRRGCWDRLPGPAFRWTASPGGGRRDRSAHRTDPRACVGLLPKRDPIYNGLGHGSGAPGRYRAGRPYRLGGQSRLRSQWGAGGASPAVAASVTKQDWGAEYPGGLQQHDQGQGEQNGAHPIERKREKISRESHGGR